MCTESQRRPVLLVSKHPDRAELRKTLACQELRTWNILKADGVEQARFLVQHQACDVVLIDQGGCGKNETKRLFQLSRRHGVPIVILTVPGAAVAAALPGVALCLPRELTLAEPTLLHGALEAALRERVLQQHVQQALTKLRKCRRHAGQLLTLLWEVVPSGNPAQWLPQRCMHERLEEEVARAWRYRTPLSVAVGILPVPTAKESATDDLTVRSGIVERIVRGKRRSDIAGQYGPHGFMLIMPGTAGDGAAACCRRLLGLVEQLPTRLPGRTARACVGIASHPGEAAGPAALLARAEQGLEQAQAGGTEHVVCV